MPVEAGDTLEETMLTNSLSPQKAAVAALQSSPNAQEVETGVYFFFQKLTGNCIH